jgi:hypothetical protein
MYVFLTVFAANLATDPHMKVSIQNLFAADRIGSIPVF